MRRVDLMQILIEWLVRPLKDFFPKTSIQALGQKGRDVRWLRRYSLDSMPYDGTDRQTDGQTPNRCSMLYSYGRGQYKMIFCEILHICQISLRNFTLFPRSSFDLANSNLIQREGTECMPIAYQK